MLAGKTKKQSTMQFRPANVTAPVSFYNLSFAAGNGVNIHMEQFRGKKLLLCNTASNCGYTAQYAELESLYQQYKDRLVVIGFPANDFNGQEPLSDEGIAQFCQLNFGVSFTLAQKSRVIAGEGQHPIFRWLGTAGMNGWCAQQPTWNFCKYLVSEKGELEAFFSQVVSPLDKEIISAINKY